MSRRVGSLLARGIRPPTPFLKLSETSIRTVIIRHNWDESKSRTRAKSGPGRKILFGLLALMPVISFGLGTWQVKRLRWKQGLISEAEDRLLLPPLDLPAQVNVDAVNEFDCRRVKVTGEFDHSKEFLVGPRLHDGRQGYFVVTPLLRKNGSTLLVFRGWVNVAHKDQRSRPKSLVKGQVTLNCLLHRKPAKNMFTPEPKPGSRLFHFMDIDEMAHLTGAQPIYLEALIDDTNSSLMPEQLGMSGIPIGGVPKVSYRNTHFQYILTWYGLSLFTTIMLIVVLRQRGAKPGDPMRRKMAHARKWQ